MRWILGSIFDKSCRKTIMFRAIRKFAVLVEVMTKVWIKINTPCCCSCGCLVVYGMLPWSPIAYAIPRSQQFTHMPPKTKKKKPLCTQESIIGDGIWIRDFLHALHLKNSKSVMRDRQHSGNTNHDISNSRYNVGKRYDPTTGREQFYIHQIYFVIWKCI